MLRFLFLSLASRVECLQRINLAVPSANNLPAFALGKLPASWLGHVQPHEANVFRFPSSRQQIVGDVLEMWLDACGVVEGLVVAEVRECFRVLLELHAG
jgi:hypothetical protein